MGCGCQGSQPSTAYQMTSVVDPTLYAGPCRSQLFILVGRNTPNEKVFTISDVADATAWSIEHMAPIVTVRGQNLPAEAVEPLCSL